jgi:hypothetical protein
MRKNKSNYLRPSFGDFEAMPTRALTLQGTALTLHRYTPLIDPLIGEIQKGVVLVIKDMDTRGLKRTKKLFIQEKIHSKTNTMSGIDGKGV